MEESAFQGTSKTMQAKASHKIDEESKLLKTYSAKNTLETDIERHVDAKESQKPDSQQN